MKLLEEDKNNNLMVAIQFIVKVCYTRVTWYHGRTYDFLLN
jgi:hypothetical protein